ncbi:MAG TPA: hypothetical protein VJB08_04405 [Candidatus Nanoarchaeia archaeon]|nr:hypothetical protein [Candidatus Nanoarchaeia archaeon]
MLNKPPIPAILAALALGLAFALFGPSGIRSILTLFLYAVPVYVILLKSPLSQAEKAIYSLFIGIGIIPSFAYWLSLKYASLSAAAAIVFFLLIGVGVFINKRQHTAQ